VGEDIFEGGKKLPVVEEFYTLQGEGYHTGKAAYFIRIGGCDIGCRWCDTVYSWNYSIHPVTDIKQLIGNAASYPARAVVVTGGEPLMWNLNELCLGLKEARIDTYLETSGVYPLTGIWDWICLSPKKQMKAQKAILDQANELKVIISDESDFEWAIENSKKVNKNCHLYLQPEWSVHKEITPVIIDFIKQNPQWCISLQAHKFMKIP
jgi:7-carboxy-7-deazaguanine synthase